ncbi:MAG: DUF4352 domain-containing protein [Roseburia sp.]|nr:DUF4352 domain-containing protein [Roseburia sp.]
MAGKTKLCRHCKSEIAKDAKVCPNCRKKQGGILKWVGIAIVVIFVIGLFGGDEEESSTVKDVTNQNISEPQVVTTETSDVAEDVSSQVTETKEFFVAGESFEVNGLVITINEISTDFTDYEDTYNLYTPEEGTKYIMVSFTYQNNDDTDAYVSIYDFDCYADGTLCDQTYYFNGDFVNGNISSGRNVSFETHYVVPADAAEIELEYTANVWTDEKVIIKVQ